VDNSEQAQELYHEIFGSVLDRSELTPYLLRDCPDYPAAMSRATLMMANRGFDVRDGQLSPGEKERAAGYVRQAVLYMTGTLFPTVIRQLKELTRLQSAQAPLYAESVKTIANLGDLLSGSALAALIAEDARHLFLLASAAKYPHLFQGYPAGPERVPPRWRMLACAVLKMCHLIKAIEEDSQDIYDYACLGLFFEANDVPLTGLYGFRWDAPPLVPTDESARRAFVKLSAFFRKLYASISTDEEHGGLIFNSGDGVKVEIIEVKARLKSPESMFAKLGKDASEEAYNIRDILAVTFLLKKREDSLTLFHALQKQGVILQENTASTSITQTLFDSPEDMRGAVRQLMGSLARREGLTVEPGGEQVAVNAESFFRALSINSGLNPHTSGQHRKFQCKINFSVPVHHDALTHHILIPGTGDFADRGNKAAGTRQHTLPVELRISDIRSWEASELKGEAHHAAYKCRQLLSLMHRLFSPLFNFPQEAFAQLRADQDKLFR